MQRNIWPGRHKPRFLGYEVPKVMSGKDLHAEEFSGQNEKDRTKSNTAHVPSEGGATDENANPVAKDSSDQPSGTHKSQWTPNVAPAPNEEPNEPEFLRGYVPTDLEDRKGHLLERINHLPDDKDGNQVSHNDTTALPLGFDVSNGDLGDLPSGNFPSSGGWV